MILRHGRCHCGDREADFKTALMAEAPAVQKIVRFPGAQRAAAFEKKSRCRE